MKPAKVTVACPHCGHGQPEARDAYSTVCRQCGRHFRLQEAARAVAEAPPKRAVETRGVTCFKCGTALEVPRDAESTMCKRCSTHVDLRDYEINQAVSKNFRTHGAFIIGEKGYVFNTEADVGEAVIKGRFLGKLVAHRSLTLHSTAEIRGTFQTALLIVPAGSRFFWKEPLRVGGVQVGGELAADVDTAGTVSISSTGRLFGNVTARGLVVESGAVLVGDVRVRPVEPDKAGRLQDSAIAA